MTCRKVDGEYVFFDSKNGSVQKCLVIKNMFLFGDELCLIIGIPFQKADNGLLKHQHATPTLTGPDREKLNTFVSSQ